MNWSIWDGAAECTLHQDGWVVRVGGAVFAPSHDSKAIGVLCFAFGLDNRADLFHAGNTPPLSNRWLVWHFCAMVSRPYDIAELEPLLHEAMNGALGLCEGHAIADEVRQRFNARLQDVRQHWVAAQRR